MFTARGMASWVLLLLLYGSHSPQPGHCENVVYQEGDGDEYEYYRDSEDDNGCHPTEADLCFDPLKENLLCHLVSPVRRNCTLRGARDFCLSLADALACCGDIVDTSCSVAEGRKTFDVWLTGLKAVHRHLCLQEDHLDLVNELLQSSKCWKLKRFTNCVEDQANLTHVSDLLTTHLDLFACNRLQVAIASCNSNSEKNRGRCRGKGQVVFEALVSFFSATSCGLNLTSTTTSDKECPTKEPSASPQVAKSRMSSAVAVIVTIMVMLSVMAVVGLILGRYGILTLYISKLRARRSGSREDGQAIYNNF